MPLATISWVGDNREVQVFEEIWAVIAYDRLAVNLWTCKYPSLFVLGYY